LAECRRHLLRLLKTRHSDQATASAPGHTIMKQSHITTPRTLADCTFTTGHSAGCATRRNTPPDWVYKLATMAACVALGVMLAWRG